MVLCRASPSTPSSSACVLVRCGFVSIDLYVHVHVRVYVHVRVSMQVSERPSVCMCGCMDLLVRGAARSDSNLRSTTRQSLPTPLPTTSRPLPILQACLFGHFGRCGALGHLVVVEG